MLPSNSTFPKVIRKDSFNLRPKSTGPDSFSNTKKALINQYNMNNMHEP